MLENEENQLPPWGSVCSFRKSLQNWDSEEVITCWGTKTQNIM